MLVGASCRQAGQCESARTSVSGVQEPASLFSLRERSVLVTGGSKGLGKAIARGMALAGAKDVVISARNEAELRVAIAEVVHGTSCRGHYVVADLQKPEDAQRLGEAALRLCGGRVDVLVNNAGVSHPGTIHKGVEEPIAPMDTQSWDATLAINLSAGMHLVNSLAPAMVAHGWGRVVHVSSIGGLGSSEGRSAYSATKSALLGLTNAGALELGPHGVTVNAIAPGPFLTEMPLTKLSQQTRDGVGRKVPLRRWGDPIELVGPVLMLVSDAGAYVNGATLRVDGGLLSRAY